MSRVASSLLHPFSCAASFRYRTYRQSWKYRSFKKKTEGGEGPKFRGVSIADGGDGVEKVHPRPPGKKRMYRIAQRARYCVMRWLFSSLTPPFVGSRKHLDKKRLLGPFPEVISALKAISTGIIE